MGGRQSHHRSDCPVETGKTGRMASPKFSMRHHTIDEYTP